MPSHIQEKEQLVRCIRMLEQNSIMDYNGHASIKIAPDHMLINTGNCQRSQLTIDHICQIDFDGNVIEGRESRRWSFIFMQEFTKRVRTLVPRSIAIPIGRLCSRLRAWIICLYMPKAPWFTRYLFWTPRIRLTM